MKEQPNTAVPWLTVYGNIEGAVSARPELNDRYCELICFCTSIAQFTLNGTIHTAYKNDVLLLSPSDIFENTASDSDIFGIKIYNDLLLWISTAHTDFTQIFAEERKLENFGATFTEKAAAAARRINDLNGFENFGDDVLSISEIAKLLIDIYRMRRKGDGKKARRRESRTENAITAHSVMTYIDMNYTDPQLDLNKIATALYFSASRLSHIFKNETGDSIYHYLTNKRLQCAHDLIMQGKPIMDACSRAGFRSYCSFYRMYIKHFGVAPTTKKKKK